MFATAAYLIDKSALGTLPCPNYADGNHGWSAATYQTVGNYESTCACGLTYVANFDATVTEEENEDG